MSKEETAVTVFVVLFTCLFKERHTIQRHTITVSQKVSILARPLLGLDVADLRCACRHWTEKDALPWAKQRLASLLGDVELAPGLRITGLSSMEGEAVVNNRKKKIIVAYELDVKLGWAGSIEGRDMSGSLRLPYISEENHDEDPELQVATTDDSPASRRAKEAILASGKKVRGRAGLGVELWWVGVGVREDMKEVGVHSQGAYTEGSDDAAVGERGLVRGGWWVSYDQMRRRTPSRLLAVAWASNVFPLFLCVQT